ncbi:MAG: hypothetical protein ABJB86_16660 [Bacteroidota bacterium]
MSNFITLAQAIEMTTTYRKEKENILTAEYRGKGILPVCETFEKASFTALLGETDCQYIRVYLAMDEDLQIRVIVVGADSKNADILPVAGLAKPLDGGGNIVEDGIRCPDLCPPPSPINS